MQFSTPTPQLPVQDVALAQTYYRDRLGFQIEWQHDDGRIGAVSHGECAIFFRATDGPIHPATFWVFVQDVDATYEEFVELKAEIVDPIGNKPWSMRQFTVQDLHGHQYHFHHDL